MDDVDSTEAAYRTLFRDVSPHMVLVEQVGRIDYFCIGSIIQSDDDSTLILTQAEISEDASLSVRFFDGRKQSAVRILYGLDFSILKTKFHPKCKQLQFFTGEVNFTKAAALAPFSSTSAYNLKGFVIQKSLKAGGDKSESTFRCDEHRFVFSCRYGATCPNGISRLISGPVFNFDRQVLGFVIEDLRSKHIIDKADVQKYIEKGFMLKVCITTAELERVLADMLPTHNWRSALKALAKKVPLKA